MAGKPSVRPFDILPSDEILAIAQGAATSAAADAATATTKAGEAVASASAADADRIVVEGLAKSTPTPNKLPPETLDYSDFHGWTFANMSAVAIMAADDLPCIQITSDAGADGSMTYEWTREEFKYDVMSASLQPIQCDAAAGGSLRFRLRQFDSLNTSLNPQEVIIVGSAGFTFDAARALASFEDIAIDAAAVRITLQIVLQNSAGATDRTAQIRYPNIREGVSSVYAPPNPTTIFLTAPVDVYLDGSTGSDSNSGTYANPLSTMTAASALVASSGGVGRIHLLDGSSFDYEEHSIPTTDLIDLEIFSPPDAVNRFMGGLVLTGISKTAGKTQVYEAEVSAGIAAELANVTTIFQYGIPDPNSLIDAADRHALQRGYEYALPDFALIKKISGTVDDIDVSTTAEFILDGTTIYMSGYDGSGNIGGDLTGSTIRVPSFSKNVFAEGDGNQFLRITGMQSHGYRHCFWAYRFAGVIFEECIGAAAGQDTFRLGDNWAHLIRPVSWGAGNDGINTTAALTTTRSRTIIDDPWVAFPDDDAISPHSYCEMILNGGLLQDCGDRGVASASGAHSVAKDTLVLRTALVQGNGEAFCQIGNPTEGFGGQLIGHNVIAKQAKRSFGVGIGGGTDNRVAIFNGQSIDPTTAHLSAYSDGVLDIYGGGRYGAATEKELGVPPGVINVYPLTAFVP